MHRIKPLIPLVICMALVYVLNKKWGDVPPIGPFTNPFMGFWQNADQKEGEKSRELLLEGLQGIVVINFDERHIPHITAENDNDLYFAQGYITAKDRLWQMDFQTRFAAGRLSEVVGEKAIELDKYQRRMGMAYGAEKMVEEVKKDTEMTTVMQAYADGVNAYIQSLKPKDYPLEFKLLNYKPEKWEMINSALLLKMMSATLASSSDELYLENIRAQYGDSLITELFDGYPKWEDPIIPIDTKWNFTPLAIDSDRQSGPNRQSKAYQDLNEDFSSISNLLLTAKKEEHLGSNNWAVSGSKSKTGAPLLANDPHLNMTLPSIWYQIQLSTPDIDAAGVSIPGAPCIIVGMNRDVAWGVTNVGSDVLDWYEITFGDAEKNTYLSSEGKMSIEKRIEEIKIRGKGTIQDTVYYTHLGPIPYLSGQKPKKLGAAANVPEGYALKWVAHQPSNDVRTFYLLNRAKDHSDYRNALSHFTAPAQNFVFADKHGDIAMTSNGYLPLKQKNQGKFFLSAEKEADDWHGRIPFEHNPTVKNPPRGFVSSANQFPVGPSYPYYLDWQFAAYDRGHRINQVLAGKDVVDADDMRLLQLDTRSVLADNILDTLISNVEEMDLDKNQSEAFAHLIKWDKSYRANSIAATIFDTWYNQVEKALWNPWFKQDSIAMRRPGRDKTLQLLLGQQASKWFVQGNERKTISKQKLIKEAFQSAVDELVETHGPMSKKWEWASVRNTKIEHLAGIPAFSSPLIYTDGSQKTVNAIGKSAGPSWRMVVELGETPRLFCIIPGGSSGNPGSPHYDDQLESWSHGHLEEFNLSSKDETITYTLTLHSK
ncbi:penicillin acylase family protein [Olivibacter sitiensis]|uniref:penicillin acylase family protein n=1 Tax=Olivibacter sitiensis TaxID=376470 RepID=UPI000489B2CE|nr:penicillin acylase family protein [Olivibacter sitiensis]